MPQQWIYRYSISFGIRWNAKTICPDPKYTTGTSMRLRRSGHAGTQTGWRELTIWLNSFDSSANWSLTGGSSIILFSKAPVSICIICVVSATADRSGSPRGRRWARPDRARNLRRTGPRYWRLRSWGPRGHIAVDCCSAWQCPICAFWAWEAQGPLFAVRSSKLKPSHFLGILSTISFVREVTPITSEFWSIFMDSFRWSRQWGPSHI